MENKLPDDQLEHFLRNSFKDYSEKPSGDVWDKIDYSLDHPLKKAPPLDLPPLLHQSPDLRAMRFPFQKTKGTFY